MVSFTSIEQKLKKNLKEQIIYFKVKIKSVIILKHSKSHESNQ